MVKLGLKNISDGAYVTPATIVTTISQVSQLKIQFNVPEKYGSQLRNGQASISLLMALLKLILQILLQQK